MVSVQHKQVKSILANASGFISDYDYTLNPYSGCAFGCIYCYAAFFAPTDEQHEQWGKWVEVKENALELLQRKRKRPMIDKKIYMSSVTDPYQPVERKLELTRAILRELLDYHQVRLVVQTRSPLVTRDLDLLREFKHVRVNMTITTDDENVRQTFEPYCASTAQRLAAIATVAAAGVEACVTMAPLLPVADAAGFAESLLETGVERFAIQDFHLTNQRFVASTGDKARSLLQDRGWGAAEYRQVKRILEQRLPDLREGRAGFVPVWL